MLHGRGYWPTDLTRELTAWLFVQAWRKQLLPDFDDFVVKPKSATPYLRGYCAGNSQSNR